MEGRMAANDMAFDGYGDDQDDDAIAAPARFLAAPQADPADLVEAQDWQEDASGKLFAALSSLDPRSRDVIERRWLADNKTTLHDLAGEYSISAERIRQIEKAAMKKLKTAIAA